jgi:UDP-N-acetylmuramoylalanine--D-glutamate ligase
MAKNSKKVKAVVAIGVSSKEIAAAFSGACEVQLAGSMRDAVKCASKLATSGDVVLLSPGCASYDWYKNYVERGADFKNEVWALIKNKQIKN